MDISLAGSGITYRPDDEQLGGLSLEFAAFDGEVGTGQLPVPDPTAAISVYDGRAVRVDEGSTRLTDGFIIDQDRDRGPMPAATARVHTFSVMDANALLDGFRVSRSRPAETDYARVMAFAAADGPSWDTTWVLNTETVTMPAKRYDSDGGWTSELIPDLVEFTGKTLWLHDLADGSGRCLHYHNLTSGHGCGLEITDVIPDVDYVTTWFPWSPRRQRTSVDLRNDVVLKDQAGRTSATSDATSISRHDADGLQHQALVTVEAASQADLDVMATAFLNSNKDERDTFTCQIGPLDEDALALIRVGDIITVTSSVMGLTASDQRIAHMTLSPTIGEGGRAADGFWMATLELGAPVRRRNRRPVKVTIEDHHLPDEPWVCVPTDFLVAWNGIPVDGGLATLLTPYGDTQSPHECTLYAGATYRVGYTVFHPSGSNDVGASISTTTGPTTLYGSLNFGGSCPDSTTHGVYSTFGVADITPSSTDSYVLVMGAQFFLLCDSTNTSVHASVVYLSGADPRFSSLPACSNGEPGINQLVRYTDVLGDGTTTAFETAFDYLPGSLHVTVNGLDWTPEVNEDDPTTGDYSLDYPVPLGATSIVEFRRAA